MKGGRILASGTSAEVITADIMAEAYGVEVQISTSDTGEPLVVPVRRLK